MSCQSVKPTVVPGLPRLACYENYFPILSHHALYLHTRVVLSFNLQFRMSPFPFPSISLIFLGFSISSIFFSSFIFHPRSFTNRPDFLHHMLQCCYSVHATDTLCYLVSDPRSIILTCKLTATNPATRREVLSTIASCYLDLNRHAKNCHHTFLQGKNWHEAP